MSILTSLNLVRSRFVTDEWDDVISMRRSPGFLKIEFEGNIFIEFLGKSLRAG